VATFRGFLEFELPDCDDTGEEDGAPVMLDVASIASMASMASMAGSRGDRPLVLGMEDGSDG
jgi:hypothetical protein